MNNNLPWDIIIAKFEGISLSEEEQSQLQNWLAADNKNKLLFDELKTLWDSIQAKYSKPIFTKILYRKNL